MKTTFVCWFLLAGSLSGATVSSIKPAIVNQTGAPLVLLGRSTDGENLFKTVLVGNDSAKRVLRAQFGWIVSDRDRPTSKAIGFGNMVDLNLDPQAIRQVGGQSLSFSAAEETLEGFGATRGSVALGVVYVRFDDGTEWSYSLAIQQKFGEGSESDVAARFTPQLKHYIEETHPKGVASSKKCLTKEEAANLMASISREAVRDPAKIHGPQFAYRETSFAKRISITVRTMFAPWVISVTRIAV